jgi:hypothetical protein
VILGGVQELDFQKAFLKQLTGMLNFLMAQMGMI